MVQLSTTTSVLNFHQDNPCFLLLLAKPKAQLTDDSLTLIVSHNKIKDNSTVATNRAFSSLLVYTITLRILQVLSRPDTRDFLELTSAQHEPPSSAILVKPIRSPHHLRIPARHSNELLRITARPHMAITTPAESSTTCQRLSHHSPILTNKPNSTARRSSLPIIRNTSPHSAARARTQHPALPTEQRHARSRDPLGRHSTARSQ